MGDYLKNVIWEQMGQSIQACTKKNLWKAAFTKFEGICSA